MVIRIMELMNCKAEQKLMSSKSPTPVQDLIGHFEWHHLLKKKIQEIFENHRNPENFFTL